MKVIFVSTTKIGRNPTNILKLLYFTINLHFVTSNQIFTDRKLNLPFTSSIYVGFWPLEMLKWLKQIKNIPCFFLLCLKRNNPQTFTSASWKNPFLQCVCYWYNLLWWMFFIVCDKLEDITFHESLSLLRFF